MSRPVRRATPDANTGSQESLLELKSALERVRSQRDDWQAIAHRRLRPKPQRDNVLTAMAAEHRLSVRQPLSRNILSGAGLGGRLLAQFLLRKV
jgi:hypothetical protein